MPTSVRGYRAKFTPAVRFSLTRAVKVLGAAFLVCSLLLLWIQHPGFRRQHALTYSSVGSGLHTALREKVPTPTARLHLLIPATSSNPDLCKLLLSSEVLGYPTPVLINYGDVEDVDARVQHLAKVQGILNYLEKLETSDEASLVLIVDGYDIWFQLRPDVLLKRYYAMNAAADAHVRDIYGDKIVRQHDMRQTVVFGPDKVCWPPDQFSRPACWAVPDGPLDPFALGPETNHGGSEHFDYPSWLNSGTILGPPEDLKRLFRATIDQIRNNHVTDSDQYYFSNVFGEQEYYRLRRRPDLLQARKDKISWRLNGAAPVEPPNATDKPVEFHVGIDYESAMFQTLAFWKQDLTWTRAIDAWHMPNGEVRGLQIPQDIVDSRPPFAALQRLGSSPEITSPDVTSSDNSSSDIAPPLDDWSEVELHYNAITHHAPVLIHITGLKDFRYIWWQKLWFQSRAKQLHAATQKYDQREISSSPIGGYRWFNREPEDAEDISAGGKMGAYTDRRGWLSWRGLCKDWEHDIFDVMDDRLYHPAVEAQGKREEAEAARRPTKRNPRPG